MLNLKELDMPERRSSKPKTGTKETVSTVNTELSRGKGMVFRTATAEDYRKRAYETIGPFYRFENGKLKS